MLALLVFYHLTAAVGAPKLSSFRKKTETPPGAHVVNDGSTNVREGPAAVPSVRAGAGSQEAGKPRTFAPAEEFEARLLEAKNRAKEGGQQATQARADANEYLESLVTAAEQLQSAAGDLYGASVAFDRALEAEPTSPRALANRAKLHYDLKELEAAERLYRKSLVAHPVDPSAWLNLALVQLRRGLHLNDARMHAERALSLLHATSHDSPAQQMLSQAHGVLDAIHAAEAKAAVRDEL